MKMMNTTINLIGISRLRMGTDGKGIRTLVAAQGCPLRCKYCLNPHSWSGTEPTEILTVEELHEQLKVDHLYFLASEGGVTFGGGEPLLYAQFIREFVDYIEHKWNIAVETSLNVPKEDMEKLIGYVDRFIVDIKSADADIYRAYTGCDNRQVLDNLAFLLSKVPKEAVLVRVPQIPEYTTEADVERTAEKLRAMGVTEIEIFPYYIENEVNIRVGD